MYFCWRCFNESLRDSYAGGGNEHFNDEPGKVWLERAIDKWPSNLWINPIPMDQWDYSHSISLIKEIFSEKMVPLTIKGLERE